MRVLVCGGRAFGVPAVNDDFKITRAAQQKADAEYWGLWRALDSIHAKTPIKVVIHGVAQGADEIAASWAASRRQKGEAILVAPFKADWRSHGKAAGPLRNQRMIDDGKPDLVLAAPGSRGTLDMVTRAVKAGIAVQHLSLTGESDNSEKTAQNQL